MLCVLHYRNQYDTPKKPLFRVWQKSIRQTWTDPAVCTSGGNRVAWGKFVSSLSWGNFAYTKHLLNCTLYYTQTPTVGLFPTVTTAAQWISPQTKQPMKAIVTSSVREKLVLLWEPICVARNQTIAWVIGKLRSGTVSADVVWSLVIEKYIVICFTH